MIINDDYLQLLHIFLRHQPRNACANIVLLIAYRQQHGYWRGNRRLIARNSNGKEVKECDEQDEITQDKECKAHQRLIFITEPAGEEVRRKNHSHHKSSEDGQARAIKEEEIADET